MTKQTKVLTVIISILALIIVFLAIKVNSLNNPYTEIPNSQETQISTPQDNVPAQEEIQQPTDSESDQSSSNNQDTINTMLGIGNRLNINMEQEPDSEVRSSTYDDVRDFVEAHFDSLYDYELVKTNPLHPQLIGNQDISSTGKQQLGEWFVKRASELNDVGDISNANFLVAYTERSDGSTYVYGVVVYWGNGLSYQIDKWLVETIR